MDKYCIRNDYRSNPVNKTLDEETGEAYWTKDRLFMSQYYQYHVYQKALEIAQRDRLSTILDVGCGPATKLNIFFNERFQLYGVDQLSSIIFCRKLHKRGIFVEDNIEFPGYGLKKYLSFADLIICSDVIEHMNDPDRLISFIKAFAHSKTTIVFSTPDRDYLAGPKNLTPSNPCHIREWSHNEFVRYLHEKGFHILEHSRVPPFLLRFNMMTIKFLINRLLKLLPINTNQMIVCRVISYKE